MIFRSPHPDISIPAVPLTDFVLAPHRSPSERVALVDASTGRTLTYGDLRERVRRVASGLAELSVEFIDAIPKSASAKILRRVLAQRHL